MRIRISWLVFLVFAVISCSSSTDDWAETCKSLASSQFEPGNERGGVPIEKIDAERAIDACQRAVADDPSKENLFRFGRANEAAKNYASAISAYANAGKQNYPIALVSLGVMHADGLGVQQDYSQALRFFRRPAGQGLAVAQYKLGLMYYEGLGVRKDLERSQQWLNKAEAQGHLGARELLLVILDESLVTVNKKQEKLTVEIEGIDTEIELLETENRLLAIENDAIEAFTAGNFARAWRLADQNCERGKASSCWVLGVMVASGEGAPPDKARANALFERACKGGDQRGCENLQ